MSDRLTVTERKILRLWDAGMPIQRIADKLQVSCKMVRAKVALFHTGSEYADATRSVAAGSAMLRDAIMAAPRSTISNQPVQGGIHG